MHAVVFAVVIRMNIWLKGEENFSMHDGTLFKEKSYQLIENFLGYVHVDTKHISFPKIGEMFRVISVSRAALRPFFELTVSAQVDNSKYGLGTENTAHVREKTV